MKIKVESEFVTLIQKVKLIEEAQKYTLISSYDPNDRHKEFKYYFSDKDKA